MLMDVCWPGSILKKINTSMNKTSKHAGHMGELQLRMQIIRLAKLRDFVMYSVISQEHQRIFIKARFGITVKLTACIL